MAKRILIVVPSNGGTIGLCSLNLYKALQQCDGVTVKCVVVHKLNGGYHEFEGCEWCIGNTSAGVKRVFSAFYQVKWLKKIKAEFLPDITISTLFSCSTISILSGGRDKKIGIFHSPHTQVRVTGWINYQMTLLIYRFVYPHLDYLYCVSNEVRRSILDTFRSIPPSKVKVVYNVHDEKNVIRKSLEELTPGEMKVFAFPVVLYCGRLDKNKAPDRLLKAFAKLKRSGQNAQLVFLGKDTDGLWSQLERFAKDADISDCVHYWGAVDNPYKYMRRAKVLVSCSYSEGLPGVLIESLLLDVPVVTTNSSEGVWEILGCEENYQPLLKEMFMAENGIITPNLSEKDKNQYGVDVDFLVVALKKILADGYGKMPFRFGSQIKAENILKNYII